MSARVVVRKVDPVEQVTAITTVLDNRFGPTSTAQEVADFVGTLDGSFVLRISGGDTGRPHRVEVDDQPAPAGDGVVRGRLGNPVLDPVDPAIEVVVLAGVGCQVDRVDRPAQL